MAWRRPGDKPLFEPMIVSFTDPLFNVIVLTYPCYQRNIGLANIFCKRGPR